MMASEKFSVKKSGKPMGIVVAHDTEEFIMSLAGCYTVAQTKAAMVALSELRETGKAKIGKYSIEKVQ